MSDFNLPDLTGRFTRHMAYTAAPWPVGSLLRTLSADPRRYWLVHHIGMMENEQGYVYLVQVQNALPIGVSRWEGFVGTPVYCETELNLERIA